MSKRPEGLHAKGKSVSGLIRRILRGGGENNHSHHEPIDLSSARLDLRGRQLERLPEGVTDCAHVTWMSCSQNSLHTLPPSIGNMTSLKMLRLFSNCLERFPAEIGYLTNLSTLDAGKNHLVELCSEISYCSSLTELNLQYNRLTSLPSSLGHLQRLRTLNLYINQLHQLPESLGALRELQELDLSHNRIDQLPQTFGALQALSSLVMVGNRFTELPAEVAHLTNLQKLDCRCNYLEMLPEELCVLPIRTLFLCSNQLGSLPQSFGRLEALVECRVKENLIRKLPTSIGQLVNLRFLHICDNLLEEICAELGQVQSLIELDASGNRLTTLPPELDQLKSLERLYLSNNLFQEIPSCVGQLSAVQELHMVGNKIQSLDNLEFENLSRVRNMNLNQNSIERLPPTVTLLQSLVILELAANQLRTLPDTLSQLSSLTFLNVAHNQLESLPACLGEMSSLQLFYVSYNHLEQFQWPDAFAGMQLEEFVCAGNGLDLIPSFVYQMKSLTFLDVSGNNLKKIDASIQNLVHLKSFFATGNQIQAVAEEFGCLVHLVEIDLSNNALTLLPDSFVNLTSLIDVDISHNQIQELAPDFRCFHRLAQLKVAHNRLRALPKVEYGSDTIPWISCEANELPPKITKKGKYGVFGFDSLFRKKLKGPKGSIAKQRPYTVGWAEMKGRRPDQQDAITVVRNFRGRPNESFFGLYDGHGGTVTSEVVATYLHVAFIDALNNYEQRYAPEEAFDAVDVFVNCFEIFQSALTSQGIRDGSAVNIVYLKDDVLYVANAGDSRSVLSRDHQFLSLSEDHKPYHQDERDRIEESGGFVTESKRVNGVLALSRALGDCDLHPPLSCKPDVKMVRLTDMDEYIIMGCDGLWDITDNQTAVELIRDCSTASEAAVLLRDFAYSAGSTDNISVVVVKLK